MIVENESYTCIPVHHSISTHSVSPRNSIKEYSPRRTSISCSSMSAFLQNDSIDSEPVTQRSVKRTMTRSEKNLSLFSQNFNQLITGIKNINTPTSKDSIQSADKDNHLNMNFTSMCNKVMRSPRRNKSTKTSGLYFEPEDSSLNFTDKERVSDFYEYTEECMRKISTIPQPKPNNLKKVTIGRTDKQFLALFDLDETLIHCIGKIDENTDEDSYQHQVEVSLPMGKKIKIGINIRPYLRSSLELIKKNYTVALYTASHQSYTDAILKVIDPNNELFDYRLYRNNCIPTTIEGKSFFIKDVSIIEDFPIEKIVIIDNSVLSFAYQLENGIPIVPYYEGEEDSELPILSYYLNSICKYRDLREANSIYVKLKQLYSLDKKDSHEDSNTDDEEETEKKKETTVKGFQICLNGIVLVEKKEKKEKMTKRIKKVLCNFRNEFKQCSQ